MMSQVLAKCMKHGPALLAEIKAKVEEMAKTETVKS